jgi:hypothetical protein
MVADANAMPAIASTVPARTATREREAPFEQLEQGVRVESLSGIGCGGVGDTLDSPWTCRTA